MEINKDKTIKALKILLAICLAIPALYFVWLLKRVFVSDNFIIPSDSMFPTLMPGDNVLVDKTLYGARIYTDLNFSEDGVELKSLRTRGRDAVRRNDIVVFNMPYHKRGIKFVINYVYCKRCIALPGDSISAVNGHYKNNSYTGLLGVMEEQDALEHTPDSMLKGFLYTIPKDRVWTIKNFGPLYVPRKGDLIRIGQREVALYRPILEWELGKKLAVDKDKGIVTAEGQTLVKHRFRHNYYFMAGDNVLNSKDSRYWGLVPEEYIVGKVTRILFSKDRQTEETRWKRTLKKVY